MTVSYKPYNSETLRKSETKAINLQENADTGHKTDI